MKLRTLPMMLFRRNWPSWPGQAAPGDRVAIAIVNFNTAGLLAHLLFSVFRVLPREQVARVLVVDNASTDLSPALLRCMRAAGLIDVLFNRAQRYHGPALNQAMQHLAAERRNAMPGARPYDYVWILDSDTIVLRADAIGHALAALRENQAGAVGQLQPCRGLPEGYAHISSLLLDPQKVWRRSVVPFENSGTPAKAFQLSLKRRRIPVSHFPFRSANYVLHVSRGTLRQIKETEDRTNRYYDWAVGHFEPGYHGYPHGPVLHENFLRVFGDAVPKLTPEALSSACQRVERVPSALLLQGISTDHPIGTHA